MLLHVVTVVCRHNLGFWGFGSSIKVLRYRPSRVEGSLVVAVFARRKANVSIVACHHVSQLYMALCLFNLNLLQGECAVDLLQKFQKAEYGEEWVQLIDAGAARSVAVGCWLLLLS